MAKNLQKKIDGLFNTLPKNEAQKFRGTPTDETRYKEVKHKLPWKD